MSNNVIDGNGGCVYWVRDYKGTFKSPALSAIPISTFLVIGKNNLIDCFIYRLVYLQGDVKALKSTYFIRAQLHEQSTNYQEFPQKLWIWIIKSHFGTAAYFKYFDKNLQSTISSSCSVFIMNSGVTKNTKNEIWCTY